MRVPSPFFSLRISEDFPSKRFLSTLESCSVRQCAATLTTGNPSLFTGRNIVTGYRDDADNHLLKARTEADGLLRGITDGYNACTDARPCVSATDEYNAFGQKERGTVTYPPA